jgi:hypothetical protein
MFTTALLLVALAPAQPVPRSVPSPLTGQFQFNPKRIPAAPAAPELPAALIDAGWELRIELARPAEPVFVGESPGVVRVTVSLKNVADKERGHVPAARAIEGLVLDANITDPKGTVVRRYFCHRFGDTFKDLTPLAAGKTATYEVQLNQFGFRAFREAGKHTLQMTYTTPDGCATSNAVKLDVIDPL